MAGSELKLENLPDPGDRYQIAEKLGTGVYSEVYAATDSQAGNKRVAIKVISVADTNMDDIREEYRVLKDLSSHPNLPDLYGVFLKREEDSDKLWFVMELCEGGPITDMVRALSVQGRKMSEEHIAYILKEVVKALVHLHQNHVMHRDVKGSNILLTKDGEVKLVDFGLSRELASTMAKSSTCLGSPCWMAPEVVASGNANSYDNRADVWALGIVAIELGDGKPPFHDMHPTRALFQIVRNPPPTLFRPASWSKLYNDFITECLEKNPEHRPFMVELVEHPFLEAVPQNDYHLQQELRTLNEEMKRTSRQPRTNELAVRDGRLHTGPAAPPEEMRVEDLAALDNLSEDAVLHEVHERYRQSLCYTFVGDILLALNPNEHLPIYTPKHHVKYQFKSRSDNSPHVFAVADRAYQDVLHHEEQQSIVIAGESLSGKTTQMGHLVNHLAYLGKSGSNTGEKVNKALEVVQALGNAETPLNRNSSRHILLLQMTFTRTGKLSGAIIWLFQLEKWRVTIPDKQQGNFHVFYYLYDGLEAAGMLEKYHLESGHNYRFLRRDEANNAENAQQFRKFEQNLRDLELEEDVLETLRSILAAILLLGELVFTDSGNGQAALHNPDVAAHVASLLALDEKKFCWALVNYCVVEQGTAQRRRHTPEEANEARDVLAAGLYMRVVDWIINLINWRLSFSRAVYGDTHVINILDLFGFEGFKKNSLEQLFVNTMNEQLQYHYNQHVFAWEMQEQLEEELPVQALHFQDNKPTLDALLIKPDGLLYLLDSNGTEAEELIEGSSFISLVVRRAGRGPHLGATSAQEFSVAHYTGTVVYDARGMVPKNRDFLPPDILEVLRLSTDPTVQMLFTARLSRTGNLTMEPPAQIPSKKAAEGKRRWGAALMGDERGLKKYNTASRGQFSQAHRMRTASAVFRATSLEVLRLLSTGGVHFIRCVRSDLAGQPRGFQPELVRQQLRALAVLDTARARQKGHPYRVPFAEFIRRYKFLAFDFDENVEETKENSRLLLVRLKMEGWVMGKTKVFLTYYNEEYLSRLYETQVKKIVRVQAMMRAFLARRNMQHKADTDTAAVKKEKKTKKTKARNEDLSEESAAILIQKQFRGYQVRKELGPLITSHNVKLDANTATFIRQYCNRWKARTIFQVLLLYRAARHQDLVYFSQQAHLYNQHAVCALQSCSKPVSLNHVDPAARASTMLGQVRPPVRKLPFRLHELPFFDTSPFCEMIFNESDGLEEMEDWDAPLRRNTSQTGMWNANLSVRDQEVQTCSSPFNEQHEYHMGQESLILMPFCRDPEKMSQIYQPVRYNSTGKNAVYKGNKPQQRQTNNNYTGCNNYNAVNSQATQSERRQSSIHGPAPYKRGQPIDNSFNFPKSPSPTNKPSSFNKQNDHNLHKGVSHKNRPNNPIVEMELRGRQVNVDTENDAPPFNFQGMLRKTNHNRASLKRADNNNSISASTYYPLATTPERPEKNDMPGSSYYSPSRQKQYGNEPGVRYSPSTNMKSSQNQNHGYMASSYADSQTRNRNHSNIKMYNNEPRNVSYNTSVGYYNNIEEDMINRNEITNPALMTELAPGIIVQGQVSEL
ncbi:neither inactivation nor afterpotential protein C [Anabrus simplex]|uniref:neither inactivation nor afterpotential protein C n=1 Tax=Anabrus simplex TaxID=316456 RepID=UPI0035A35D26